VGCLEEAYTAALAGWFNRAVARCLSSVPVAVVESAGFWRNDEAFARLLLIELGRGVQGTKE
jgi:hypothetical protein